MPKKIIHSIIIIVLVFNYLNLSAQNTPVNFTGWYAYEGTHAFKEGKPWGLFGEAIIKRQDIILKEAQLFFRVGLNYNLKSGNRLTAGFAAQFNTPYDEVSQPYNWPDYRIWEQYMIRKPKPKGMWVHRFRMEQRWLGRKDNPAEKWFDEFKFENTFRYMIRKTFTFNDKMYGIIFDEIHIRTMTIEPEKLLDQNRIYAGVGFILDKKKLFRIETGYMYQPSFKASPEANGKQRINHAFRISFSTDIPFME